MPKFKVVVKYPDWMQEGGITQTYSDEVEADTLEQAIEQVQSMAAADNRVRGEGPSASEFEFLDATEIKEFEATYIDHISTRHTGGGCMVDLVHLKSGHVIGITDESVVVYPSESSFDDPDNFDSRYLWAMDMAVGVVEEASALDKPVRYYAVTGRVPGDDEDTITTGTANDDDHAREQFIEAVMAARKITREELIANDEGMIINTVVSSDSPITIETAIRRL